MYRANWNFNFWLPVLIIALLTLAFSPSFVLADPNEYGNIFPEEQMMGMAALESIELPFDPNAYSFLIYVPYGSEDSIERAMDKLGISYDKRDWDNDVTANDLATHDILIVGWNVGGDTSGLDDDILEAGITGRVVLSGHDLDFHTAPPSGYELLYREAAEIAFIQAIDFVLKGSGTGMIALGDIPVDYPIGDPAFSYLPASWGISAIGGGSNTVTEFTFEGLDSGIFDFLEPLDMCNWDTSYHDTFTIDTASAFVSFELGGDGDDIITVSRINSYGVSLSKTDNLDPNECVSPEDEITYTIPWSRSPSATGGPIDLEIVDYLPLGTTFVSANPDTGVYNQTAHSYTWIIYDVDPGDSGSVSITVAVNELATPLGVLINRAALYNNEGLLFTVTEETPVCCWTEGTIFVDDTATGMNSGTSWQDAYVNLQDALARADADCGDEIWVAQGVYLPGVEETSTFHLVDGVEMYGGFRGDETQREQRDPARYKSILSGNDMCNHVITADDVDNTTILDGFTIRDAVEDGITCTNGAEPMIATCIIEASGDSGVYISASSPTLDHCLIRQNDADGVELNGAAYPIITHCIMGDNDRHGVYIGSARATIGNCFIKKNGVDGVNIASPSTAADIYNVTLTLNTGMGIYQSGGSAANAYNCILWDNNTEGGQYWGCDLTYSCYLDPNNLPGSDTPDGNHNITSNPSFAYDDPANGHLRSDSDCIDIGYNYTGCTSDVDIDDEGRVFDGDGDYADEIDMGCDEYTCEEVEHEWDFNHDGIINLLEYAPFAAAWLKDSNDPNWIDTYSRCDFYEDQNDVVDINDFCAFAEVWLWQACWRDGGGMMMAMGGGGDGLLALPTMPSSAELETAKLARWREIQPAFEPTPQFLLWQIEDCIDWLEYLWATDEDIQNDISAEDFAAFLKHLYSERDELMEELAAKYEAAP